MSEYPITVGFDFPHTMLFTIQNLAGMAYAVGKDIFIEQFVAVFCSAQPDEKVQAFYRELAEVTYQHACEIYNALIQHYNKTLRYDSQLNFKADMDNVQDDVLAALLEKYFKSGLIDTSAFSIDDFLSDMSKDNKPPEKKDDFGDLPPIDFELN